MTLQNYPQQPQRCAFHGDVIVLVLALVYHFAKHTFNKDFLLTTAFAARLKLRLPSDDRPEQV